MSKKQPLVALVLYLVIPAITMAGGALSNLINPEIAAGHANYAQNFHLLQMLKIGILLASFALAGCVWLFIFYLLARAKDRTWHWMILALFGPFGLIVLASLDDTSPAASDRYARFLRSMHWLVRAGWEILSLIVAWEFAWQAMSVLRTLIIHAQAVAQHLTVAQIIDQQNASSGMWAFGEFLEVLYFIPLLYLVRPFLVALVLRALPASLTPKTT